MRDAVERPRPSAGLVPRCQGTLLAPSGPDPATLGTSPSGRGGGRRPDWARHRPVAQDAPHPACLRATAGSRCGRARPRHRAAGRRPLGPTPRYAVIPRWGLVDHFDHDRSRRRPQTRSGPSARHGAGHADRDHGGARCRGLRCTSCATRCCSSTAHAVEPVGGRRRDVARCRPPACSRSSRSSPARSC